jgi:hypothetical protein
MSRAAHGSWSEFVPKTGVGAGSVQTASRKRGGYMSVMESTDLNPDASRSRRHEMYARAVQSMPGGTSSDCRAWEEIP